MIEDRIQMLSKDSVIAETLYNINIYIIIVKHEFIYKTMYHNHTLNLEEPSERCVSIIILQIMKKYPKQFTILDQIIILTIHAYR